MSRNLKGQSDCTIRTRAGQTEKRPSSTTKLSLLRHDVTMENIGGGFDAHCLDVVSEWVNSTWHQGRSTSGADAVTG